MQHLLDLDSLCKVRDIKIKEISSLKKPRKPNFTHIAREFLKVLALGILFFVFFLIIHKSSDKTTIIFVLTISLIFIAVGLIGSLYIYRKELKRYQKKIKNWDKYKKSLIRKTEAKFDDYAHQLIATGTIHTDDPYIKQALGLVPKCPTCGSTDIASVSGIRRDLAQTAFGVANPTARAQFKCNNCGYKW